MYASPDRAATAYDSFAEVTARSENGVLCLLSALRVHDLTTQQSSGVWLAIPHKAHAPRFDYPPLRVIRMSGPVMTEGVETVDVALEALRDAWNGKRATMDELWRYAEICRVANVLRPYLETVGAA